MDSYILTTALDVSNDPLMIMLSSMDSTATFFDPFAPTPFPWTLGPKFQPTYEEPTPPKPLIFTPAQIDAVKHDLASPIASPCPSLFEIEDDTTKYEPCYDEFMDTKLSVIKELSEKVKVEPVESVIEVPLVVATPLEPALSLPSLDPLFEDVYTMPDTFIDDLWVQMNSAPDHLASSPSPSTSTTCSTSSSVLWTPTPPSSTFSCPTPEPDISTWFDLWDNEGDSGSGDDNPRDGDYLPGPIRNEYFEPPRQRHVKRQTVRYPQAPMQMNLSSVPLPDTPVSKTKETRKAPSTEMHDAKRPKVDPEVVCRIDGCRHISKTRFECFKHRETHFPGRFRCPHPECLRIFVRSSSLARHLKRPGNVTCRTYAGGQSEWGVGLINFALRPPAWLESGFLDDI